MEAQVRPALDKRLPSGGGRPKAQKARRRRSGFPDVRQLFLPLFTEIPELRPKTEPDWVQEAARDVVWTNEGIINLHYCLFDRSLEDLNNPRIGREIFDDIVRWVVRRIDTRKDYRPLPFSFQACTQLMGVDPEEMQAMLIKSLVRNEDQPIRRQVLLEHMDQMAKILEL